MVGFLQRTLRLRTAPRHLSPHSTFSSATTAGRPPVDLCGSFLPASSRQSGVRCRKLHSEGGSEPSPAAAPDRRPFSKITWEDLDSFRKIVPGRVITDPDLLESSNVDWLKSVRGKDEKVIPLQDRSCTTSPIMSFISHFSIRTSSAGSSEVLLRPQTTEEVSQILK